MLYSLVIPITSLAVGGVNIFVIHPVYESGSGGIFALSASASTEKGPLLPSPASASTSLSIAFLLGAWHLWVVVENKPASSLVVFLGKALNGTPHLCAEDRLLKTVYLGNSNSQESADMPSKT